MVMSCCFGCILVMLNSIFGLFALILLAVGCAMHFFGDIVKTYFASALDNFKNFVPGISFLEILDGDGTFSVLHILKQVALPFILIGVILFVICILGCCSVYCSNKTLLIVYISVLAVILLAQGIVVAVIAFKIPNYRSTFVTNMQSLIENQYKGVNTNSSNVFSAFLNIIQFTTKCCGIQNYTDFDKTKNWDKTAQQNTQGYNGVMNIPASCCVMEGGKPKDPRKCMESLDENYSFIDKPCMNAVDNMVAMVKDYVIAIVAGILGIQLLVLLLAICFCQSVSASKIGPV